MKLKIANFLFVIFLVAFAVLMSLPVLAVMKGANNSDSPKSPIFDINAHADEPKMRDYCKGAPECYLLDEQGNAPFWPLLVDSIMESSGTEWTIDPVDLTYDAPDQEPIAEYAYRVSGGDKDFLYTLRAENGTFDPDRRSDIIGANGYYDMGLCQLNYQWHSDFIDSPDFQDWKKQVEYCWQVFSKRPGAFYGYFKRHAQAKYFAFR